MIDQLPGYKNHDCEKPNCAYCNRLGGEASEGIVKILNMPGVKIITDKKEQILEFIYLKKP